METEWKRGGGAAVAAAIPEVAIAASRKALPSDGRIHSLFTAVYGFGRKP